MKYENYQVWYHTFNNALSAFGRRENLSTQDAIRAAENAANVVLEKFKDVEMPKTPDLSNLAGLDLQNIVQEVSKQAAKKS